MISIRSLPHLLLLALSLSASSAATATATAATHERAVVAQLEASTSTIGTETPSEAHDPRGSERTASITAVERLRSDREVTLADIVRRARIAAPRDPRPSTWCDLVQCRRAGGAQALSYATPPPARV